MGEGFPINQPNDRREASHLPNDIITEAQQENFRQQVKLWSGPADETDAADTAEDPTQQFMRTKGRHRTVTQLVKDRTKTHSGIRHERGDMVVVTRTTDDFASLRVERRTPQTKSGLDEMVRVEYVIDGPDMEVVGYTWFVDRESGKRVESDSAKRGVDDHLTFGHEHIADITLPSGLDETDFTQARYKELQAIFTSLGEEGWERTLAR